MRYVVYNGSREIYRDMLSAVKSLLAHTRVDRVFLLIEDDVFPYELPEIVETRNVRGLVQKYFRQDGPNYSSKWTPIGLIRYALTKVFTDFDRILAIDADTIVVEDIGDLFHLPLEGYYVAGAKEPVISQNRKFLYVNAGVLMMNLKKLREDRKDDEIISLINRKHLFFVGQDATNYLCQDGILQISSDYNASDFTEPTEHKKVLHFAGKRDWLESEIAKQYREMPWTIKA